MHDTEYGYKRPPGRPRFSDGKAKSARLSIRILPRKLEIIQRAAFRQGQKLTHWIEDAIDAKLHKEDG